jgi:hypothetical protein
MKLLIIIILSGFAISDYSTLECDYEITQRPAKYDFEEKQWKSNFHLGQEVMQIEDVLFDTIEERILVKGVLKDESSTPIKDAQFYRIAMKLEQENLVPLTKTDSQGRFSIVVNSNEKTRIYTEFLSYNGLEIEITNCH